MRANELILTALVLESILPSAFAENLRKVESVNTDTSIETVRVDENAPKIRIESDLIVGNKGEEVLDVSTTRQCASPLWVFDHAELLIERNRFGHAQFVRLPQPGCFECEPIRVRWFHEPTGFITFSVRVFRREIVLECEKTEGEKRA